MNTPILKPKEDYKNALKLVESTKLMLTDEEEFFNTFEGFTDFTQLFRFTNENITEYYGLFDFKNKDVLTVIGSGDQALSAIYKGCKNVDIFDINKLSYYFLMLKKHAIEALTYDEYLSFFNPATKYKIIDELYLKISKSISDENIKKFWDLIFTNSHIFYFLFLDTNLSINRVKNNIPYLKNENEYNQLKEKINNVEFNYIGGELTDIINLSKKRYDYINLSNIIDYIDNKKIAKKIYTKIFKDKLNKNGMCMLEYEWYLYACCNDYLGNLFIKYQIEKHTMKSEEVRPSSAYIYRK